MSAKPAPYSNTDTAEREAITCFKNLLDLNRIKPDIKSGDKIPNVDGYLELVDSKNRPTGKVEVQVKKIPKGVKKYSCPTSLFAYSRATTLPVILVCVDTKNKVAYWKEINTYMAGYKEYQKTFTIHFDDSDSVDGKKKYIQRWKDMCSEFQRRIAEYPELVKKLGELARANKIIEERNAKIAETEEKLKEKGASNALAHFRAGDYDKADKLFEAEAAKGSRQAAEANYYRGNIAFARLLFMDAAGYYEKAATLDPENSDYLNMAGGISHDLGDYKRAIGYFEQALAIDKKSFADVHPNVAIRLNNIGMAWQGLGDYKRAIGYYKQSLGIDKKFFGDEHPKVAIRLNNIGLAWQDLGEYKRAIGYYKQALGILGKARDKGHPYAATLNNLGLALNRLGEYKRAIGYHEQALAIDKRSFGDEHPNLAVYTNNIGMAWQGLGEYKRAIEYYEKALAIDKKSFGDEHPRVAIRLNNIGGAWDGLGEYKKAIGYYEQALKIARRFFDEDHPTVQTIKRNLDAARSK